jgi:hypothetical protein
MITSIFRNILNLLSILFCSAVFLVSLLGNAAFPEGNLIDIIKVVLQ